MEIVADFPESSKQVVFEGTGSMEVLDAAYTNEYCTESSHADGLSHFQVEMPEARAFPGYDPSRNPTGDTLESTSDSRPPSRSF